MQTQHNPELVIERFWTKVEKTESCWLWAKVGSDGYGRFSPSRGHQVMAHRYAYELLVGAIPQGLDLDHLCRTRACVNPAHMEPVTRAVNVMRGIGIAATNARKTHCKHGHPLDEGNTYTWSRNGARACLTCHRIREAQRYHRSPT